MYMLSGSGYAARITLSAVTCDEPWVAQVRAQNEMGPGPPTWYTDLVRNFVALLDASAWLLVLFPVTFETATILYNCVYPFLYNCVCPSPNVECCRIPACRPNS